MFRLATCLTKGWERGWRWMSRMRTACWNLKKAFAGNAWKWCWRSHPVAAWWLYMVMKTWFMQAWPSNRRMVGNHGWWMNGRWRQRHSVVWKRWNWRLTVWIYFLDYIIVVQRFGKRQRYWLKQNVLWKFFCRKSVRIGWRNGGQNRLWNWNLKMKSTLSQKNQKNQKSLKIR